MSSREIVRFRQSLRVRTRRRFVHGARCLLVQGFMRSLVVEHLDESVEALLLLQKGSSCGTRRFGLKRLIHLCPEVRLTPNSRHSELTLSPFAALSTN
jgi:hypothetical protein